MLFQSFGMHTVIIESMTAEEEGVTIEKRQAVDCCLNSLSSPEALVLLKEKLPRIFHAP